MTLATAQVSVGTTAALVIAGDTNARTTVVVGNRGAASVFVGGSAVTTATGFEVKSATDAFVHLDPGEALYGIVASGTVAVSAFRNRTA
jgi:hypothetical protein